MVGRRLLYVAVILLYGALTLSMADGVPRILQSRLALVSPMSAVLAKRALLYYY